MEFIKHGCPIFTAMLFLQQLMALLIAWQESAPMIRRAWHYASPLPVMVSALFRDLTDEEKAAYKKFMGSV